MLTFLFLVSLTATTVLLLSIAGEEVARVTRALLAQGNGKSESGVARTSVAAQEPGLAPSHETAELRQFPQRARAQARASQSAGDVDRIPDRAA